MIGYPIVIVLASYLATGYPLIRYPMDTVIRFWGCAFLVLWTLRWQLWRCPHCRSALSRWNDKGFMSLPFACRHCGEILNAKGRQFKKVPANLQKKPTKPISPLSTLSFLGIGIGLFVLGKVKLAMATIGGLVVMTMFRKWTAEGKCRKCGSHLTSGNFCDQCGHQIKLI